MWKKENRERERESKYFHRANILAAKPHSHTKNAEANAHAECSACVSLAVVLACHLHRRMAEQTVEFQRWPAPLAGSLCWRQKPFIVVNKHSEQSLVDGGAVLPCLWTCDPRTARDAYHVTANGVCLLL